MFRSQSGDTMICVQSSKPRKPKNVLAIFWANLFNWNGVVTKQWKLGSSLFADKHIQSFQSILNIRREYVFYCQWISEDLLESCNRHPNNCFTTWIPFRPSLRSYMTTRMVQKKHFSQKIEQIEDAINRWRSVKTLKSKWILSTYRVLQRQSSAWELLIN